MYLIIEDTIIINVNFITDICGVIVATGSQTTLLTEGRSLKYAERLTPGHLNKVLMGMPDDE